VRGVEVLILMSKVLEPILEAWLSLPLPLQVWLLALVFVFAWVRVIQVWT